MITQPGRPGRKRTRHRMRAAPRPRDRGVACLRTGSAQCRRWRRRPPEPRAIARSLSSVMVQPIGLRVVVVHDADSGQRSCPPQPQLTIPRGSRPGAPGPAARRIDGSTRTVGPSVTVAGPRTNPYVICRRAHDGTYPGTSPSISARQRSSRALVRWQPSAVTARPISIRYVTTRAPGQDADPMNVRARRTRDRASRSPERPASYHDVWRTSAASRLTLDAPRVGGANTLGT